MRLFVTGASGWIGTGVVRELLAGGHRVIGLARSDASAAKVAAAGADVLRGDLTDPDGLRAGARAADGVVHLAYHHDFARMAEAARMDRAAIDVMAEVTDPGAPFAVAAGVVGLATGRVATERDAADPAAHVRNANARAALDLAGRGIRPVVVRFAPTVHGRGDHGFVAALVATARRTGVSGYVGDGANRWPAVHRDDAAVLVRRAVEAAGGPGAAGPGAAGGGSAGGGAAGGGAAGGGAAGDPGGGAAGGSAGSVVHAVAEEGVPAREIAEAIGRGLDVPVKPVPADHFGWLGRFFAADVPASAALTRERYGWAPARAGLIADLDEGHYFTA